MLVFSPVFSSATDKRTGMSASKRAKAKRVQTVPVEDARQNGVQSIHDCALYGTQDVLKDIRSLRRHILPRSPCGCRLPGWWMEKRMRKRTDCRFEKRGPRRSDLGK